ncbi:ankyrin repeat-containing domain protein [Xylaria arbuscula]|nr:ankyrin repeat-containing domain protein [Xylaria arbuscula]
MDPLSLTASIIAVVTAAGQISKGLRSLRRLRHAPEEISELHCLLCLVQTAARNVSASDLTPEVHLNLKRLLDSAKEPLQELDGISFTAWIRSRRSVGALRKRLVTAHRNITTALVALSNIRGQAETQLILNMHDLFFDLAKEPETLMTTKEEHTPSPGRHLGYASTETLGGNKLDHDTRIVPKNSLSPQTHSSGLEEVLTPVGEVTISTHHGENQYYDARLSSSQWAFNAESCVQTCGCQCHTRTMTESCRWLSDVLGTLFYSYAGNPFSTPHPCNTEDCLQPQSSSYQFTYHFPRWMLNRALTLAMTYRNVGSLSGFCSISFPRAIPVHHKMWLHIQRHELEEVRNLLRNRIVYVDDMSEDDGTPLLTYALKFRSYDIVGLLLQNGANLDLVDPRGISARAYAQSSILIDRPIQRPPWLACIGFNSDELGTHNDLCFNPLHYVIIGLEKADLHQQLRLNGAHKDSTDTFGRSPLHWAVITGNINAVEALIAHGASTTCVDRQKMTPLHAVYLAPPSSQVQCGRLLVDSGADIDALDAWKRTPIRIAAGFKNTNPEFLDMLIQRGADINRQDIYGQSALLKSIQGRKEATQLLLYYGASTEAPDEYGNTPILEAIYRDEPQRLQMLLEHGAKINEPFELMPGRSARSGPVHLLDFVAWYGSIEVMDVIKGILEPNHNVSYSGDNVEGSKDFRMANGRKVGEKECEAFRRILSK